MSTEQSRPKKFEFPIPPAIILAICACICIIALDIVGKSIGREYIRLAEQSLFISDDLGRYTDERLEDIILSQTNGLTRKIEVYDAGLNVILQLSFRAGFDDIPAIVKYERLRMLVEQSAEGQTVIEYEGAKQAVFYQWLDSSEGNRRLVVIFSATGHFPSHEFVSFISYLGVVAVWGIVIAFYHNKDAQTSSIVGILRRRWSENH